MNAPDRQESSKRVSREVPEQLKQIVAAWSAPQEHDTGTASRVMQLVLLLVTRIPSTAAGLSHSCVFNQDTGMHHPILLTPACIKARNLSYVAQ